MSTFFKELDTISVKDPETKRAIILAHKEHDDVWVCKLCGAREPNGRVRILNHVRFSHVEVV